MSEPVAKDRPTVDLDDFERRLRQRDREHEDPLAELARLVGETSDPYDEVFARERGAHDEIDARAQQLGRPTQDRHAQDRHAQDSRDQDLYSDDRHAQDRFLQARYAAPHRDDGYEQAAEQSPYHDAGDAHGVHNEAQRAALSSRLAGDFASIEAGLRGAVPVTSQTKSFSSDHEFHAQNELYATHGYAEQGHEAGAGDVWPAPVAHAPSRSKRSIYAMVATIAIGVIGVGVAFAYKGSNSSPSEIRTIAAASGPTKVQPPAESGTDAGAGQDSAMLGKNSAQTAPTRLVNGEEQPVDIGQAVQENASPTADAGVAPGDASNVPVPPAPGQSTASAGNGQPAAIAPRNEQMPSFGLTEMPPPKKVKVVSVRPDGTILPSETAPTIDSVAQTMPPLTSETSATPTAKPAAPKTSTPKSTSRVSAKPAQTASVDADDTAPTPKTVRKAKPKKVAALEQPADGTTGADQAAATATGGGGFAVQLAAPGSEAEAKSATSRLAKKFSDALDGRRLGVHKAQSNGKSVFRVRVSSLSKDDAVGLCEKLKAAGGSCFVAKN